MSPRILFCLSFVAGGLIFLSSPAFSETLNPEGINPHADSPRKKITQAQKQAAADAMKKKKAEIEAKKKATNVNLESQIILQKNKVSDTVAK